LKRALFLSRSQQEGSEHELELELEHGSELEHEFNSHSEKRRE
jgi:hypothetical protein